MYTQLVCQRVAAAVIALLGAVGMLTACAPVSGGGDGASSVNAASCSAAEQLFSGLPAAFADDGNPVADPARFSATIESTLRGQLPDALQSDLDALLAADLEPDADIDDATARLQEWAIRGCGIEVAFADEGSDGGGVAGGGIDGGEISVGGDAGIVIVSSAGTERALELCQQALDAGAASPVLVIDRYGMALAGSDDLGSCAAAGAQR